jgi:hypothetical protein
LLREVYTASRRRPACPAARRVRDNLASDDLPPSTRIALTPVVLTTAR